MASSEVEIVNIALQMLGADPITSLTEATERASLGNQFYASARDAVLREHEWNFAQVRVALARESTNPAFGYAAQFPLPADPYCLRVNETDPWDAEYRIEGRRIVTDETSLSIRYTAQITDPTQFDAMFVDALATKLATKMAYPLTESASVAKEMETRHQLVLSRARSIDSQESSVTTADINVLLDARVQGFPSWTRNNKVI